MNSDISGKAEIDMQVLQHFNEHILYELTISEVIDVQLLHLWSYNSENSSESSSTKLSAVCPLAFSAKMLAPKSSNSRTMLMLALAEAWCSAIWCVFAAFTFAPEDKRNT